jgi:phage tail tube protein FII
MAANNTVYTMESANLICGDAGQKTAPGISTHLVLQELKLPGLEENYVDHAPGGAPIAIEIPTHMNKLEATFNLAGWDPDVMVFIGQEQQDRYQRFTAYGLIRDRRSSEALQAIAIIQGRLGRVNPTAFSKGNLMAHEFSIKSIVHYELWMQRAANTTPSEVYWWDFFTSVRRIGGRDLNDDMIRLLSIPGNAVDSGNAGAEVTQA